jgi:WD40 repeat protein
MTRRPRQYEAFISYSHQADSDLAAALQRALNRIARPPYKWWQWWPPRVFRDQTNLAAAADLGGEIRSALLGSGSFVLLASPPAAASEWVNQEVTMWCTNKPRDRLFIALTEGELAWDEAKNGFDPARTDALPPALDGVFEAEPLWVDLTGARTNGRTTRDPRFMEGAATLAAAIRGAEKDALIGEDLRQHRRTRQLVGGAIALLTTLTVLATLAAVYAAVQRNRADNRARLATSRQLAAEAVSKLDVDPEQSLVLAARATRTATTSEAVDALRQALRSSRLRSVIAAGKRVLDAEVSPTGALVAAALADGTVRVWNADTQKPVARLRLGSGQVRRVSFSRDGRRLLAAGDAGVAVWLMSPHFRRLARFDRRGRPLAAALSANGRFVATGDYGVVRIWRAETGALEEQLQPPGRPEPVWDVAFSTHASRVVAATDSRVTIWNLHTGSRRILRPHGGVVWSVAFSPDGLQVAAGSADSVARIWDLRTGEVTNLIGHEGNVKRVAFSPDGSSVVTASEDKTARIWDVRTGRVLTSLSGHTDSVESASFASDGKTVVTGGFDRTIRFWSVTADPVLDVVRSNEHSPPEQNALQAVGFDPAGKRLVTAGEDLMARVWDPHGPGLLRTLRHGHRDEDWVESAEFDPTGRFVLTAGDDGTAKVWGESDDKPLTTLGGRSGLSLYDAAFSPDGRLVVAGGLSGAVRLWRWRRERLVRTFGPLPKRVDGVAFSPDGKLVAAASEDSSVRVWRVADGAWAAVFRAPKPLTSVAIDPTGWFLAAGDEDGGTYIWDLRARQRQPVARFVGHSEKIADVAFSADGSYLATAGEDGLAKVWTVPEGELVTTFRTRASRLEATAFAPRGRDVAVAGWGGRATVFDCAECRSAESLVCLAARRVTSQVRAREKDVFGRCD